MNLSESLSILTKKLESIDDIIPILEAKGHLDHPEDLVFLEGSTGASRAVNSMLETINNPNAITIKWDGYPALIFGRGPDGKFGIMDKHMFNKKDGAGRQVHSPTEFVQYDQQRGVDRTQLHEIIASIWNGLEKSDSRKGYYWGDLLFSKELRPDNGLYKFRANPNGISYTVDVNSDMGKFFTDKSAGIVVHQYMDQDAASTDEAVPLNGTIGHLKNNSNVAIVPAKMPVTPTLKENKRLITSTNNSIAKYGAAVDQLMNTAPQAKATFSGLFTTYINRRIVSGNLDDLLKGFLEYFHSRPMTDSMRTKLTEHFKKNKQGLLGAFSIWINLYKLKMSVVDQLNKAAESSPVKGYLQDGTQTQEGFVSHGLKFVNRMGFSRQNLAGR